MNEPSPETKIVGVRLDKKENCKHVSHVKLENGHELKADDLMSLMDAGRSYFMIPPPGAPAYEAHKETGYPLILQIIVCKECKERVLFA